MLMPATPGPAVVGVPVGPPVGVVLALDVADGVADRRGFGDRDTVGVALTENDGETDGGCGEASATALPPGRIAVTAATPTPSTSAAAIASTTASGEMIGRSSS